MRGVFPLAVAHLIAGAGERRSDRSGRIGDGEASGMIEVQVRGEHDVDVAALDAGSRERRVERHLAIDAVHVDALRVHFAADPGVDDHQALAAHEQRSHRELNPVPRVGRTAPFPERLRDGPEHRPAIEPQISVEKRRQLEIADVQGHRT